MKLLQTQRTASSVSQSPMNRAGTPRHLGKASKLGFIALALSLGLTTQVQSQEIEVTVNVLDLLVNDLAYSEANGVLYATTPSSIGFPNGNSIVTLDAVTGDILSSNFAGSEPNQIAVSEDGSKVYVGIDGARAFRSWTPGTDNFGDLLPVLSRFGDPAIAADFAIIPGDPSTVVVSKDEVGSTASGDLEIFQNDATFGEVIGGFFNDADQIVFTDDNTLITYNDSSTGFDLVRYSYDETTGTLTSEDEIGGLVSGFSTQIEAEAGLIYASNGIVVDPMTLTALGTFSTGLSNAAVESVNELGMTFFVGELGFSGPLQFVAYDNDTFLEIYRADVDLGLTGFDEIDDLIYLGGMNFAFLSEDGVVGIISAPVPVPAALILFLSALGVLGVRKKTS